MKERLKEMRQWWDEVIKDEKEDGGEEECAVAENVKVLAQVCVCVYGFVFLTLDSDWFVLSLMYLVL